MLSLRLLQITPGMQQLLQCYAANGSNSRLCSQWKQIAFVNVMLVLLTDVVLQLWCVPHGVIDLRSYRLSHWAHCLSIQLVVINLISKLGLSD